MHVDLAAQILSESVSVGISTVCTLSNELDQDARHTAKFCFFFNNLFDIFNSTNYDSNNVYKCKFNDNGISMEFLKKSRDILNHMTYCGNRYHTTLPCIIGWKININCIIDIFNHLKLNYSITNLSLHGWSQDLLENFFSRIRSRGGNRDNPNVEEFIADYRAISVDSLFIPIEGSNCNIDPGEFLLKLNSYTTEEKIVSSEIITYVNEELDISEIEENSIMIIAQELVEKLCNKFNCTECSLLLYNHDINIFASNYISIVLKSTKKCNYYPTESFNNFIFNLENLFRNNIMDIIYKNNIFVLFKNMIIISECKLILCNNCTNSITYNIKCNYISQLFFTMRLHYILRKDNIALSTTIDNVTRQNRKMLKLKNI